MRTMRAGIAGALAVFALLAAAPAQAQETGGAPQLDPGALNRFYAGDRDRHQVTTGSVAAGYGYEQTLGFLLPSGGAGRQAIYSCLTGAEDHFLSPDRTARAGSCSGGSATRTPRRPRGSRRPPCGAATGPASPTSPRSTPPARGA